MKRTIHSNNRCYFKEHEAVWLSKDVGVPLVISALAGLAGYTTNPALQGSVLLAILAGMLLWLMATLASIHVSRSSRLIFIGFKNLVKSSKITKGDRTNKGSC